MRSHQITLYRFLKKSSLVFTLIFIRVHLPIALFNFLQAFFPYFTRYLAIARPIFCGDRPYHHQKILNFCFTILCRDRYLLGIIPSD
ncbi:MULTISPECIES: hypothetical protein [unclassified Microcoleus]|uniref:hypothetical protein n=1 Tax=unclassified Microcoleus TaxID=2642155 RepID=UPI002FCEB87D